MAQYEVTASYRPGIRSCRLRDTGIRKFPAKQPLNFRRLNDGRTFSRWTLRQRRSRLQSSASLWRVSVFHGSSPCLRSITNRRQNTGAFPRNVKFSTGVGSAVRTILDLLWSLTIFGAKQNTGMKSSDPFLVVAALSV